MMFFETMTPEISLIISFLFSNFFLLGVSQAQPRVLGFVEFSFQLGPCLTHTASLKHMLLVQFLNGPVTRLVQNKLKVVLFIYLFFYMYLYSKLFKFNDRVPSAMHGSTHHLHICRQ